METSTNHDQASVRSTGLGSAEVERAPRHSREVNIINTKGSKQSGIYSQYIHFSSAINMLFGI